MTDVTYGQLDRVLRTLGFAARIDEAEPRARVYEHPSGALLMFPVFPDDQAVLPRHLDAVRFTLENYGIASFLSFARELERAG